MATPIVTPEELLTQLSLLAKRVTQQASSVAHIVLQHEEEKLADSTDPAIKHISERIEQSRDILNLEDDWDDEGSPAYKTSTWERATTFLRRTALRLWKEYHLILDAPKILPGPAGSIDLHWKTAQRELLINIPEVLDEPANFYGDNSTSREHPPSQMVKGSLDTSKDNQWLLMWLMQ
jgi:hypothetical protein